ncbi:MAG: hypothetical protein QG635_1707, partial [Bacteroidota bacterium]|nr:hypothetical protein [Bacteroidota bacterium]
MNKKLIFMLIIIFIMSKSSFIYGQETAVGIISGKIADKETLQPLPGATIRLNGAKLGAVSNREGIYAIDNVPVGRYTVEVKILGYAS